MSKESKNDRPSLVGTQINYPRTQHHSEDSFMRNARIVGFCFVGLSSASAQGLLAFTPNPIVRVPSRDQRENLIQICRRSPRSE